MIQATHINVSIANTPIVRDVTCTLFSGVNAIVGPNGAGKSTLLSVIAGMRKPETGAVHYGTQPLARLAHKDLARRRAVMTQGAIADDELVVADIVELGRFALWAFTPAQTHARAVASAIRHCGLGGLVDRRYGTLSGGERQRVHLARALAQMEDTERPILFLDEPTAAIDPGAAYALFTMLRRWADARDAVVIAVLHDLNLAARYADHVVAMNAGQVVAQGPVDKVFSQNVLAEAYQVDFHFSTHPQDGRPVVVGPVLDAYTTTTHAGVAP